MATLDAWVQTSDAIDITGDSRINDAKVIQAQGVVELHCNRVFADADRLTPRDLSWLQKAVAWEASWLVDQYGFTSRMATTGVSQDGVSAQYVSPASLTLAPLTQRALKNCSWMGTRSSRIQKRRPDQEAFDLMQNMQFGEAAMWPADFTDEASDDSHPWTPYDPDGGG